MKTAPRRLLASLALGGTALAVAAGAFLLRPPAADAQVNPNFAQVIFGPVDIVSDKEFPEVNFVNLRNRPTPPANLEWRDAETGEVLSTVSVPSVAPGKGFSKGADIGQGTVVVARFLFFAPKPDQVIPVPFTGTLQVRDNPGTVDGHTRAVVLPAR
jgi:hypothetical protein